MNVINKILRGDKVVWVVALLLGTISLIVVYSASSALVVKNYGGNTGRLLLKHSGTLLIGYAMMFAAYKIDYRRFAKFAWFLLIPCLALLLYTLVFGKHINADVQIIQLSFADRVEARIAAAGGDGVVDDLLTETAGGG